MSNNKNFAEEHQSLLKEWNYEKNGELKPETFSVSSKTKVWWKCSKCGYEWETSIYRRHTGHGCPYCANNVVWTGHNDLATLYPELLLDWDYSKNTEFDPTKISKSSKKKAWWHCHKCGYEWYAEIGSRASGGNSCPYCSGKALWTGHNDLQTTDPELAREWNHKRNGGLVPSMVTAGSGKRVWWKCSTCGYEWEATIGSRKQGNGCPVCSKAKMIKSRTKTMLRNGENTLAKLNPKLALEWNYEKNELIPEEITASTNYKAWWTCPDCGYVYCSSVSNRHRNGTGCPVCANQIFVRGINDLQTKYPDIAAEWSEKNDITPDMVVAGSHTKYYFKCSHCGHEWKASLISRIRGNGCPKCSSSLHTSIPEQVIYRCLKKSLPSASNSYKPNWLNGKEIDIYLPTIRVGIEYDGSGWHQAISRDIEKTKKLKLHGIDLIRIREPKCPSINDGSIQIVTPEPKNDLQYLKKAIDDLFCVLNDSFHANIDLSCNIDEVYQEELMKYRNKELDVSFASMYPAMLKEWDSSKNKGLDPNKIPPRSNVSVWWKCQTCGYEWEATIDRRAAGSGCPYCAHEVVWPGHNDVETLRPDLLEEWDYDNNDVSPREVAPNSHKRIAWKCSKCGHRWRSPLYNKATGHGCPECGKKNVAEKLSKRVKNLDTGKVYESVKAASEETGIGHSNITRVCRGEGKKAGGYRWIYLDSEEKMNTK